MLQQSQALKSGIELCVVELFLSLLLYVSCDLDFQARR
jgi:hypothetical protein